MSNSTFVCIDAHTCGNPVRVIKEGGPKLIGDNMSEKRQHFLREFDWIRKGLMFQTMILQFYLLKPLAAYQCVVTELLGQLLLLLKKV